MSRLANQSINFQQIQCNAIPGAWPQAFHQRCGCASIPLLTSSVKSGDVDVGHESLWDQKEQQLERNDLQEGCIDIDS